MFYGLFCFPGLRSWGRILVRELKEREDMKFEEF